MLEVLSKEQLEGLTHHKYNISGVSALQPWTEAFWMMLLGLVPLWWAPNLIAIAGSLSNTVTTLVLIYHSPDAKSDVSTPRNIGPKRKT